MLFPQSCISNSFEKVDFNINVHGDYKFYEKFRFFFILKFWIFFWKFWNFMKTEIFENFLKILKFGIFYSKFFKIFKKNSGFLDSDDNARWSRITITVVCSISDVQLKIPRKLFKLPVNSSAAVNSLENYGPVNSLSIKNVKQ